MPLLYDRKETKKQIIITSKYSSIGFIFLILAVILLPFYKANKIFGVLSLLFFALAILCMILMWKPNSEIKKAMKEGKIKASGSKFSFSNPLTVIIKKK